MILVNSNPATIMTDPGTADRTCVATSRLARRKLAAVSAASPHDDGC